MSIKTSDSAIKNKLFLGFWFVLFAALILLVNWLFRLPANKAEDLLLKMTETEKQITLLTSLHAEFMLGFDKEDNLFAVKNRDLEKESKTAVNQIRSLTEEIVTRKRLARILEVDLEEFQSTLQSFDADFSNLMLITRERGNKNSGLVNQWLTISQRMIDSPESDQNTLQQISKIIRLESEYLLNRNIKTLRDIAISAEEIRRNQAGALEGTLNINDLDYYIVLTGNLVSIENRMGHTGTKGIVPDLERSIEKMPSTFSMIQQKTNTYVENIHTIWNIARFLVLLLIVLLFIYLFINVFSLVDPLRQMAGFTKKLAGGEFPEEEIAVGNLSDMHSIKNYLKNHVASLQHKFNFTRSLNQDELENKLDIAGENDALGYELVRLQQKILETKRAQEKNEQDNLVRRYMNEGMARFSEILRSKSGDLNALGDAFIREIVKYLNGLQGGFFIYDDSNPSNPVLNMISAFAYNRKKFLQQTISLGEGLVGTCAKEKKYMNFTEIPEGYITITSGLGDTPPGNLLIVPVLHENELLGVIEIASLNIFEQYEIEFASEVALTLGSTLVNTRNNQRTSELLTKSQQQALEMSEQEEEMRQNMEELKATQEESIRREDELRGIVEAVNHALMVVEYDIEGRIQDVNQNLCLFLGRERVQIIGKSHDEVFEGSLKTDINFWHEVQSGQKCIKENIKIGKKTFELVEYFTPVTNRNSLTVKYLNFISDGRAGNS